MNKQLLIPVFTSVLLLACQQNKPQELPQLKGSLGEALIKMIEESRELAQREPSQQDMLVSAVRDGRVNEVKHLIVCGVDVNATDRWGDTALSEAAKRDNHEMLQIILSSGADVNKGNPLLSAVCSEKAETVRLLLKHGADVNQMADNRVLGTPLIQAADDGNLEILRDLLAAGARLDARRESGETALIAATKQQHTEIVEALLRAGADVQLADNWNRTALWYAASKGDLKMAEILLGAGAGVNTVSTDQESILHVAATHAESVEMVQLLLRHGAERKLNPDAVYPYLHPDCAYEVPSDALLDALEAAGFDHGVSREQTEKQRLEQQLQEIKRLYPHLP